MAQLLMTANRPEEPALVRASEIRVIPSRRTLDNRFPTLCFFVETGSLPLFEVLLATNRLLFDPKNAGERVPGQFYASREDVGLLETENGHGVYHVPPVVLKTFAQQSPKPTRLYFVAIAYPTPDGKGAKFSHPPETLATSAPSIGISTDFSPATLSHVLGAAVEKLKTVGPRGKINSSPRKPVPQGPGGLPLMPPPPVALHCRWSIRPNLRPPAPSSLR